MAYKCCRQGTNSQKNLKNLKKDFEVLSDENRLRILCLLKRHKDLCVCNIFESLDLPQNLVSYHLAKLRKAGFVDSRKIGSNVMYVQNQKKIKEFYTNINNLISE